jgi:hypothetical protein
VGGQEYSRASSLTYSQAWFDPLTKKVGGPLTPLTPWNRSHCTICNSHTPELEFCYVAFRRGYCPAESPPDLFAGEYPRLKATLRSATSTRNVLKAEATGSLRSEYGSAFVWTDASDTGGSCGCTASRSHGAAVRRMRRMRMKVVFIHGAATDLLSSRRKRVAIVPCI